MFSVIKDSFRYTVVLIGISYSVVGCTAPEVYQQGSSTAIIDQQGGSGTSTTEVIKIPGGQKIITRDGRNSSVIIQQSGPENSADTRQGRDNPANNSPRAAQDGKNCTSDCVDCQPSRSTAAEQGFMTAEEFKRHILNRDRMQNRRQPLPPPR